MSEQLDESNNSTPSVSQSSETTTNPTLESTIKTPKEKKDISIDPSSTVKQLNDAVAKEFTTSIDQSCMINSGKILKGDEDLKKHGSGYVHSGAYSHTAMYTQEAIIH
ncbi:unnamed protein product [Rotaria magnacalcarata]|uniref:Ubiquitin-like domain-containing protein n=1 Tax=Rotaria magnacalcarata TaxID=392030 RepID=A0A816XM58_9BILA|nr:unnamed protein product [Rotaria magnacalcarata]CAF4253173.1 unnamed protein product [Rotaria magnacalcarata]